MADSFTQNQVQGIFGEFTAVLDEVDVDFSDNNVQGIFGKFDAVLDEAAAAAAAAGIASLRQIIGHGQGTR